MGSLIAPMAPSMPGSRRDESMLDAVVVGADRCRATRSRSTRTRHRTRRRRSRSRCEKVCRTALPGLGQQRDDEADESMPPDSSTPTGTSATMRRATASPQLSRPGASCQSRSDHPRCALPGSRAKSAGPSRQRSSVLAPSGSMTRTVAGGSLRTPRQDRPRWRARWSGSVMIAGKGDRGPGRCRHRRRRPAPAGSWRRNRRPLGGARRRRAA